MTEGAMTQDEWCAIKPNDFIECGEGPTLHRWEVYGVHIGAPGQESIVEMESKTHRSGVTGDWKFHPRVFVPIILLRACRRVPAEAIHNILTLDLDRLTGSVIDAYTLAPNDEDAKREAVRAAIERGVRPS